jgi:hypothetical protein
MQVYTNYSVRAIAMFFVAAVLFVSCNTVGHDHDHADAVGFVIEQNNAEILRFEGNQFVYNRDGVWDEYFTTVDGEEVFTLSPDVISDMSRGMTPSVTIRWIDSDGDLFDLEEEDEGGDYSLRVQWEKPLYLGSECSEEERTSNLDDVRPATIEQHGSDGTWSFHFRADHAGMDQIRFYLWHSDHADLESGWMPVHVADADHEDIDENGVYLHERDKCRSDIERP